jgi:hypothetical protein
LSSWYDDKNNPPEFGGFHVVDTYGVWGCSTSKNEQPYLAFEWNQLTVEQKNGFGEELVWVIQVDN